MRSRYNLERSTSISAFAAIAVDAMRAASGLSGFRPCSIADRTASSQHQIGSIFSGLQIIEIRRFSADVVVLWKLHIELAEQISCRRGAVAEQEEKQLV